MAQSVECLTLDFGFGCDLGAMDEAPFWALFSGGNLLGILSPLSLIHI